MLIVCQVWNRDFPHVRTQCGNHLFVPTKSISNRSHCSLVTARFLRFQPNRSKALETEKNLVKMWQTHFLTITHAACVPFSASAMCAMWRRTSASSGVQVGLQNVSLHVPVLAAPTWHFIVCKLFRCVASKAIRSKCCTAAKGWIMFFLIAQASGPWITAMRMPAFSCTRTCVQLPECQPQLNPLIYLQPGLTTPGPARQAPQGPTHHYQWPALPKALLQPRAH